MLPGYGPSHFSSSVFVYSATALGPQPPLIPCQLPPGTLPPTGSGRHLAPRSTVRRGYAALPYTITGGGEAHDHPSEPYSILRVNNRTTTKEEGPQYHSCVPTLQEDYRSRNHTKSYTLSDGRSIKTASTCKPKKAIGRAHLDVCWI